MENLDHDKYSSTEFKGKGNSEGVGFKVFERYMKIYNKGDSKD